MDLIESNVRFAAEQESTVKAVIEGAQAIIQREIPLVNLHGENRHQVRDHDHIILNVVHLEQDRQAGNEGAKGGGNQRTRKEVIVVDEAEENRNKKKDTQRRNDDEDSVGEMCKYICFTLLCSPFLLLHVLLVIALVLAATPLVIVSAIVGFSVYNTGILFIETLDEREYKQKLSECKSNIKYVFYKCKGWLYKYLTFKCFDPQGSTQASGCEKCLSVPCDIIVYFVFIIVCVINNVCKYHFNFVYCIVYYNTTFCLCRNDML